MKYPNIIFFRFKNYSEIDSYLLNDKYECTFNITDNINDLNKLFDPNYHLLITYGNDEKEYHKTILPNIVARFSSRWIHKNKEHTLNIDEFNSTINYCYINNVISERKLQRPEFSIFTTCYNTWDKFDRVYKSLINQKFKDWEWIILDDTPIPKDSKPKHFEFLREKCKNDSRIRLYCRAENSGNIGNVKNEAVSLCRGKYVLELDHDDEILPDCLFDAVEEFKDDEVGFVYMDFINIYEDGRNFSYGDFICKGYGGYYCQKYNDKWVNVYITPNINNITLSHLVCCPNHPRIWRKSVLQELENYSEFLPICDDYEILLRTALNTKIVKIHKLGYIQYMNDGNSNFSLIRNGEINRIGPNHIFPQFYQMYNVNDKMKQLDAYEDENFIFNHSQIWKRENYRHQYCNKIVNKDYKKQYCLIGEETLEISELSELYKDKTNSFIILSNRLEIERLQELLDSKGYGDMRCYSVLDCNREELERYFMLLCKYCDNYEIINSSHDLNNKSTKFIPLGLQCSVPEGIKRANLREYSYPFDWLWTPSKTTYNILNILINDGIEKTIEYMTQNYEYFLYLNNERFKITDQITKCQMNIETGVGITHFTIDNEYKEKLRKRLEKLLFEINNSYNIVFIYADAASPDLNYHLNDIEYGLDATEYLLKIYDLIITINKNIEILYFCWNERKKINNKIKYIGYEYQKDRDCVSEIIKNYLIKNYTENYVFLERHDIINNYIIKENKKSYLEIGIETGYTFTNINIDDKIGVDPDPKIELNNIIKKTSDDFFKDNDKNFDIIFIDGMHQVEYILKDFNNSVKFLNKNGIIFLDDVLPISKDEQEKIPINPIYENGILKYSSPWTGDVWKFMYYLLLNFKDKIDYRVFSHQNYRGVVKICLKENFTILESTLPTINSLDYDTDFKKYKEILCSI